MKSKMTYFIKSIIVLTIVTCCASQSSAQEVKLKKEYAMGMCMGVNYHNPQDAEYKGYFPMSVSYLLGGLGYARQYWGLQDIPDFVEPEDVQVLHQPEHGKVVYEAFSKGGNPGSDYGHYRYNPNRGYLGDDKVTFKLTVDGKAFKILYILKVIKQDNSGAEIPPEICEELPRGDAWRISTTQALKWAS